VTMTRCDQTGSDCGGGGTSDCGGGGQLPVRSAAVQQALDHVMGLAAADREVFLEALGVFTSVRACLDNGAAPLDFLHLDSHKVPMSCRPHDIPAQPSVTGCPWCRRPVAVIGALHPERSSRVVYADDQGTTQEARTVIFPPLATQAAENLPERPSRCAYVTLLYGEDCYKYFLGALVLGWGLMTEGSDCFPELHTSCVKPRSILMYTSDVPPAYLQVLAALGWQLVEVQYLSNVSQRLFRNHSTNRFTEVFTKLRALQLPDIDLVLLLDNDLLIRRESSHCMRTLFGLRPPAAMVRGQRGQPSPAHGEILPYTALWNNEPRRTFERIPMHQQAGGINAGVVLLQPDSRLFDVMFEELCRENHPEHYPTAMPEQEYLSRFYGTFNHWTHIDCSFNFEVRGWWPFPTVDEAVAAAASECLEELAYVPLDFGKAHEPIRQGGLPGHPGAVVLHFSGSWVKPWDLLYGHGDSPRSLRVQCVDQLPGFIETLRVEGPGIRLHGYGDVDRVWQSMLEWLGQLHAVAVHLVRTGAGDILRLSSAAADLPLTSLYQRFLSQPMQSLRMGVSMFSTKQQVPGRILRMWACATTVLLSTVDASTVLVKILVWRCRTLQPPHQRGGDQLVSRICQAHPLWTLL